MTSLSTSTFSLRPADSTFDLPQLYSLCTAGPGQIFFFFLIVEVELKPAAAAVIHRDVSEMGS